MFNVFLNKTLFKETTKLTQQVKIEPNYQHIISSRYKVDPEFVKKVIYTANKYSDDVFPTKRDIIVLIGIESSFKPKATSHLKRDVAVGLTQIRPHVWRHIIKNKNELNSVDNQIKYAAIILKHYHKLTGTREGAILAYNNGLTAYRQGRYTRRYLVKFERETAFYVPQKDL
jgi:hypothetical protein